MKVINFLMIWLPFIVSIGIIILAAIFFLKQKLSKKLIIACLLFLSTILILIAIGETVITYYVWKTNPFSQYLLPPHQPIKYFISYSYFHYFKNLLFIFSGSIIIGLTLFYLNKLRNNILLENKEIWLAILGSTISGWPGLVAYFFMTLILLITAQILIKLKLKETSSFRLQIAPFLIFAMAITIIFNDFLINLTNLSAIK